MATAQDLLTKVEAAITTRHDGGTVESYSVRGRNVKYVSLETLYDLRAKLKREVEQETSGGLPVAYGVKDRRLAST